MSFTRQAQPQQVSSNSRSSSCRKCPMPRFLSCSVGASAPRKVTRACFPPVAAKSAAPAVAAASGSAESSSNSDLLLGRRGLVASCAVLLAATAGGISAAPASAQGMNMYIKRRLPPPLDECVPPALAARAQLVVAGKASEAGDVKAARDLLRSGPFYRLRDFIRGLAEAASDDKLAPGFFSALEEYDRKLVAIVAQDKRDADAAAAGAAATTVPPPPEVEQDLKKDAQAALVAALAALDAVLATVPPAALAKATEKLAAAAAAVAPAAEDDVVALRSLLATPP